MNVRSDDIGCIVMKPNAISTSSIYTLKMPLVLRIRQSRCVLYKILMINYNYHDFA